MVPVLQISDLSTHIQLARSVVQAVGGISLTIEPGETLGLVGESGCGKSMTGLSIMGLLPPGGAIVGGSIKLDGRELVGLPASDLREIRGNDIAMIFQDPMTSLNPTMTIGRQIAEPVRIHKKVSKHEATDRAIEVLQLVGMPRPEERLKDYPHQLSGGLRQRVMIAMALACEPKLLIADEPTTALDVTIQAQILDLIDDLRVRLHMAVVLITHDMGVIAGRTDRVLVMYAGKIVEEAETSELFSRMRHPYAEALLASVPKLDQHAGERLLSIAGLPPDLSQKHTNCRFHPRCQYATEECRETEPPLVEVTGSQSNHRYACFHPVQHGPEAVAVSVRGTDDGALLARESALDSKPPLLVVDHLVKEFPVLSGTVIRHAVGQVHAVSDISFQVRDGETFGLVGESGCGKTTVGRMVVGLERPVSGSIRFREDELVNLRGRELRRYRRNLQLMFQDPYASLDPRMRVGTILREPLKVQRMGNPDEQRERVAQLMQEVGLSPQAADRYPHEFSGGQRQRIGLARALALHPQLIVADEPVSALH